MARKALTDQSFQRAKLARTRGRRERLDDQRQTHEFREDRSRNDLLPELHVEFVAIDALQPSLHRTRRTSPEQHQRVIASIADLGFCQPILIAGAEIIDGHTRVEAARDLGLDQVPAIDCAHLSPAQRRKLALAINRIGELGEWDLDLLKFEIADLLDLDIDLGSTGFSPQELDIIVLGDESLEEEAEAEPPPEVPVSRPGDIWIMDGHRVICGNALEPASYEALLEGNLVHMVLADYPYNVPIAGNVSGLGRVKHGEFAMASGEMKPEQYSGFLRTSIERFKAHLLEGSAVFGWMDWRSIDKLLQAGDAAGLRRVNLIVWHKPGGGMGSVYRSAHELITVSCHGDKLRTNNIELGRHGRDRTNVWSAPGANRRGSSANEMLQLHATPKPVELCVDAILDVTNRGEHVLDPFLGSGTTLIAAEKTGRRCFGIELEPRFVDVAVLRWSRLTGKQAVLAATGETWAEVAEDRTAATAALTAADAPGRGGRP